MGKGRPNKYYTHVEPNLDKVEKMALTMSEKQIAQTLGVGITAFKEYKKAYPALNDALKKGRTNLVMELRSSLIKRANGFEYEERKTVEEDGVLVREERTTKYYPPDVAALNLALKNYDADNWANDPQMLKIREKELKLREKQIENNSW